MTPHMVIDSTDVPKVVQEWLALVNDGDARRVEVYFLSSHG